MNTICARSGKFPPWWHFRNDLRLHGNAKSLKCSMFTVHFARLCGYRSSKQNVSFSSVYMNMDARAFQKHSTPESKKHHFHSVNGRLKPIKTWPFSFRNGVVRINWISVTIHPRRLFLTRESNPWSLAFPARRKTDIPGLLEDNNVDFNGHWLMNL